MRLRHRYRRRWQRSPRRRRIHVVRQELSAQRVVNLLLDVRHLAVVHAGDAFQVVNNQNFWISRRRERNRPKCENHDLSDKKKRSRTPFLQRRDSRTLSGGCVRVKRRKWRGTTPRRPRKL